MIRAGFRSIFVQMMEVGHRAGEEIFRRQAIRYAVVISKNKKMPAVLAMWFLIEQKNIVFLMKDKNAKN